MAEGPVALVGTIEIYNAGEDFVLYINRLNHLLPLNKIKNDVDKISFLISLGGAELYKTMCSLLAPKTEADYKYDIVKLLKTHFKPQKNIIIECYKFFKREQKPSETVSEYIVELKQLAQECDFGGLKSFGKACQIALSMEMSNNNIELMRNNCEETDCGRLSGYKDAGEESQQQRNCWHKRRDEEDENKNMYAKRKNRNKIKHIDYCSDEYVSDYSSNDYLNNLYDCNYTKSLLVFVKIEGVRIEMEIDTGACVSICHISNYNSYFKNLKLEKQCENLKVVTGENVDVVGSVVVEVEFEERIHNLKLVVLNSQHIFKPLLGRNWLDVIFPQWRKSFNNVNAIKLNTNINFSGIIPIFAKAHQVPFGLRTKVEAELDKMCEEGVLVPVNRSKTVNRFVENEHYVLPRVDDILASLSGWNYFCKLDLTGAYLQVKVSDRSREILTINTHKGLYQYTRLVYGLKTAPQIFSKIVCEILKGLEKVQEWYTINRSGISPSKLKIEAVLEAPAPTNKSQLRSYLGMINYYNHCVPNLSSELHLLYDLTRNNVKWVWSEKHQYIFEKSKELITNIGILTHYDPTKPIIISCDASPYGVGLGNSVFGSEISQIFLWNFHQSPQIDYIDGIFLSSYNYNIKYKSGSKMCHADALSRLPMPQHTGDDNDSINIFQIAHELPVSMDDIKNCMNKDKELTEVYKYIQYGRPKNVPEYLHKFYNKRVSLATEDECLFYGERIVIPCTLRNKVLELLHCGHIGIVRMKSLARTYVWWPGIDYDVETYVKSCHACSFNQHAPKPILTTWKMPEKPFERIHIDFCKIENITILVIVDTFFKWIEAKIMKSTTSKSVNENLRSFFSIFGLPTELVSDNGPPFSSKEFTEFCINSGIKVLKSPPYHPQSNGSAERAVQTVKSSLKKYLLDPKVKHKPWDFKINNFLLKYRTTPTATGIAPAHIIFNFKPKTLLDFVNPKNMLRKEEKNRIKVEKSETNRKCNIEEKIIEYKVNEIVLYRNVLNNYCKWTNAKIVKRLGNIRYYISVNGTQRVAHVNQLKKFYGKVIKYNSNILTYKEEKKRRRSCSPDIELKTKEDN
ncbi:hypothetical protein CVS40_10440 [Lucilia cuprina]|nr:hypothetical protein CVS40_10440 [Lucilia cuprina]